MSADQTAHVRFAVFAAEAVPNLCGDLYDIETLSEATEAVAERARQIANRPPADFCALYLTQEMTLIDDLQCSLRRALARLRSGLNAIEEMAIEAEIGSPFGERAVGKRGQES